jgi:undecaprenyl-diphosphatase
MNRERLLALDASLSNKMRVAEKPGYLRTLAMIFAHSGDSWFWFFGLALLWFLGPEFWKVRALEIAVGIFVTAVLVMIIKFSVRRRRPEGQWGNIYRKTDPHSFPSGHAARAAMLTVMGIGLGPIWFGAVLLFWAPLVGLARIAMGVHYISDVVVGMIFGGGMGLAILWFYPQF